MGCCLATPLSPEEILEDLDERLEFHIVTGGITLIRGYVQQDIPGGTLFVTDKTIVHCTKCCGYNRLDFDLDKIKQLQYTEKFGNSCYCYMPFTNCPDGYIVFRTKIDRRDHQVGVRVKDPEEVFEKLTRVMNLKFKRQLSIISEESSSRIPKEKEIEKE